ncbi:DUF2779 domain-containing protein [Thiorhodococcus mannitoliphagus]|uniref:DUF2779 domain-containing protein n=1 Tax=Thiorhodococcus mannitoliphagus TaxID=329406 RepID=A0A6P1E1K9_9GAMM|nr:DUF2779 domain-containing protein [Thiorhodococcus mannitoliphagus]NEX22382.1 DUF2779 domain-containing protein [Thiorhodococcus mannitoliphagus]
MRVLSKSKIMAHRQCPRRLWLEVNRPNLCEDSADTQSRYQIGDSVGEIARRIYDPKGRCPLIDVASEGFEGAFARTQALLAKRRGIFEAGFNANGGLAFADVLLPVKKGGRPMWRMVEVKSSTSVKDSQRDDVAFQSWVAKSAGLALAGVSIAYVDNTWVYPGNEDYNGLLVEKDLTREAFGRGQEVANWVEEAQTTLRKKREPSIQTGHHCTHPYACGFIDYCRSQEAQAEFPVEWLPDVRTKALKSHIEAEGVVDLRDVPAALLNERQQRVKDCTLSGKCYFDKAGAAKQLAVHRLPAYFLDFESVNPAVPLWKGIRPYQQIPFQFSCHRLDAKGRLTHDSFLDLTGKNPLRPFVKALLGACGERGPIFVYNASFEKTRIHELAKRFPRDARALLALVDRVVDLLPVARGLYYHPDQEGSWSIKAVLPTIAPDLDYSQLVGVQDGGAAMVVYQEAIAPTTSRRRCQEIQDQLLAYCKRDTEALVRLWSFFTGKAVGAV